MFMSGMSAILGVPDKRASGRVQLRHRTPTALTDTRCELEAANVKIIPYPYADSNIHEHTASKIGGR